MKHIMQPTVKSKALNQEASLTCKKIFPEHTKSPTQGELQNLILLIKGNGGGETEIKMVGMWWLWIRKMFIENTITQAEKRKIMTVGVGAALGLHKVIFISSRSPELLHAQVDSQGDKTLPRSQQALQKLERIVSKSNEILPTNLVLAFADLAIDNFEKIEATCNIESMVDQNLQKLKEIAQNVNLSCVRILQISDLFNKGLGRKLNSIIHRNGTILNRIDVPKKADSLIEIGSRESIESHQKMFGWSREQSFQHSRNLAITMGLVGESLQSQFPNGIIIHNEAFIARGRWNNLFTDPNNPIPVICLRDLLEKKRSKG